MIIIYQMIFDFIHSLDTIGITSWKNKSWELINSILWVLNINRRFN